MLATTKGPGVWKTRKQKLTKQKKNEKHKTVKNEKHAQNTPHQATLAHPVRKRYLEVPLAVCLGLRSRRHYDTYPPASSGLAAACQMRVGLEHLAQRPHPSWHA